MSWQPILDGDQAQRAREAIAAIASEMIARDDIAEANLVRGWAGIALLHGYRALDGDPDAPAHTHAALAHAIELLGTGPVPSPWLGTGFTGVAWSMHHLRDVVEIDEGTLEDIDAILADLLAREPWPFEYGLLVGLVGIGVYGLERGQPAVVERVVDHLERLAEHDARGVRWWNRDDGDHHNLGPALGVTGAAAFLAESSIAGIVPTRARALLDGAVAWLDSHERTDVAPRFPMCELAEVPPANVRNGWCYGDLPIACLMVRTGDVARGVRLARAMARGPVDDVADFDTAFCHGAAGRAHLFNRLAQATGDDELLEAARGYLRETLDRLATTGLTKPGLKTGRSGIALVLLAAISTIEPCWDRSFLVALPPL